MAGTRRKPAGAPKPRRSQAATAATTPVAMRDIVAQREAGLVVDNARLSDENQRLLKETEQRNAELAVINSIQQGIASELDFHRIIELAGDKLREILKTDEIGVRWLDHETRRGKWQLELDQAAFAASGGGGSGEGDGENGAGGGVTSSG